jgi:glycosyltransferase involved in cell wall biosynthesis
MPFGAKSKHAQRWLRAIGEKASKFVFGEPVTHLYCLCWNEFAMLPYFFRHYDPLVDRYFVFDDGSTDGSLDLLRQHPKVTVRPVKNDGDSFVAGARAFYNSAWRESRGQADWVLLVNIDEHLYHPKGRDYFRRSLRRGYTVLPAKGYQMVSNSFPSGETPLYATIKNGVPSSKLSKLCAFRPDAITDIGYTAGRHKAVPTGNVVAPPHPTLKLLHYKFLGASYVIERYAQLRERMRPGDRERRWGDHYFVDEETLAGKHRSILSQATQVPGL